MTINIDISNYTTCIYKILQLYLIIIILSIIMIRPEFFLNQLINEPSYCNFPESREKIKFNC